MCEDKRDKLRNFSREAFKMVLNDRHAGWKGDPSICEVAELLSERLLSRCESDWLGRSEFIDLSVSVMRDHLKEEFSGGPVSSQFSYVDQSHA